MFWCCCGDVTPPDHQPVAPISRDLRLLFKRAFSDINGVRRTAWTSGKGIAEQGYYGDIRPNLLTDNVNFQNGILGPHLGPDGINPVLKENPNPNQIHVIYQYFAIAQAYNIARSATIGSAKILLTQDTRQPAPPAWPVSVAVFSKPEALATYVDRFPSPVYPWGNSAFSGPPTLDGIAFQTPQDHTLSTSLEVDITYEVQALVNSAEWFNTTPADDALRRSTTIIALVWVPYRQSLWVNNIIGTYPTRPFDNTAVWCADGDLATNPLNCTIEIRM